MWKRLVSDAGVYNYHRRGLYWRASAVVCIYKWMVDVHSCTDCMRVVNKRSDSDQERGRRKANSSTSFTSSHSLRYIYRWVKIIDNYGR